jgi:ATP-binding cassette subfamily C (CFTR/MRP) protein 1
VFSTSECGINLSGGQKARIALARTVYHNADIVLLDSPLAAVDSHVSACLIERCILGTEGFGKKTRILVTHHLEVLPRADLILVMEGGHIKQKGTYADLVATPGLLQSLMEEFGSQYTDSRDTETEEAEDHGDKDLNASPKNRVTRRVPQGKLIMDEERNTVLGVEKAPGKTGSMYTCEDISGSNVERRARVYTCNNR